MKWTIVFDSGCDLRQLPQYEDIRLRLVPLQILVGDQAVTDDGTTSLQALQATLDSTRCKTGTACPSVGAWKDAMSDGDNVIAVTISGAVSGSYQSACAARDMLQEKDPHRNIWVYDSVSGSGTMKALVDCAAEQIQSGADFPQVCRAMEYCRSRSQIFFLLQNIDNLMSNGRLKPLIGKAVKALRLCLLATVSPEGDLGVIGKVCNFEKAMDKALEECVSRGCLPEKAIITHCLNLPGAKVLQKKLKARFPGIRTEIMEAGLLCGYYAEKGGLILSLEAGKG